MKVGPSTSTPPPTAHAPEENPTPLVGQFRDPVNTALSDYYTETTENASIRPNAEAPWPKL